MGMRALDMNPSVVIVPDPHNERGHIAIDKATGRTIARGYLEVAGWAGPTTYKTGVEFVVTEHVS